MNAPAGCAASSNAPKPKSRRLNIAPARLLEFAFGLRPIIAEGIEFRDLMQETFLRRDRDDRSPVGQQNRLAQLLIPVTQREALPLEGRKREVGTFQEIQDRLGIAR